MTKDKKRARGRPKTLERPKQTTCIRLYPEVREKLVAEFGGVQSAIDQIITSHLEKREKSARN